MKFRKDINGLRAFAVIAVVLFHFNASWMPGGFAGVDVFFVISGFLMTGIIFKGLENNSFSVLNFYVARANRIIPALAALCLVLLIFGWFYLTPLEYKALGKHAASSVGFLSNVTYWREAGYFDAASHEKWLLHTWSLSVEWQFYIIYPLVLLALKRVFSLKTLKSLIIVATVIGFIFSVYATYKWPNASYYLFPMRAWEMMLGGVAFLYPLKLQQNNKRLVEILGLILIVGSYVFITGDDPWPGYLALFPVLGTFLVIQAQRNESIITGNIIFQKLGAWSYSIYLWHWPFVVAIYTFSLPNQYIYIGMTLSVLLGYLSYKYIERIKFPRSFPTVLAYFKCKPIYISITVGFLSTIAYIKDGFINRFQLDTVSQNIVNELKMPSRSNGYCYYISTGSGFKASEHEGAACYLGASDITNNKTLLFGDSYAGHSEPLLDKIFKENNLSFQSITTAYCHPFFSDNFSGPKGTENYNQCLLNRGYVRKNINNYENIILGGRWSTALQKDFFDDLEESIDEMARSKVKIFILSGAYQHPKSPLSDVNRSIYLNFQLDTSKLKPGTYDQGMQVANKRLESLSERYANVFFLDRSALYGDSPFFEQNGLTLPYSLDGGHISVLSSKYSAEQFMKTYEYNEFINHVNSYND